MLSSRCRYASFIFYIIGVFTGIMVSFFLLDCKGTAEKSSRFSRSVMRDMPVVFIGGHPRSGTTLMRVLFDAHPSFHCGQETHIIPDLLTLRRKFSRGRSLTRLREAGLDLDIINTTIAESILKIIKSRANSKRLCSKDPFALKHIPYLAQMFPHAQFILMVRDARAVIHSIRANNIRISRFPRTNSEALRRWNKILEVMFKDCLRLGHKRCKVVQYESLVLKPRSVLREVFHFLRTSWSENVMNHTGYLDKAGGILLSRLERSTHQVRKPIYKDSLDLWKTSSSLNIPSKKLRLLAPMMETLGYLGTRNSGNYLKSTTTYQNI